jgi:hypothetical protein
MLVVDVEAQVHYRNQSNLRQNLFTLRALRMTQELELTQEQTAVIFPELNRAEKDKAELQRQLAMELRDLRLMLKEGKASPEEFEIRVARVREIRQKIQKREEAFEEFLFQQLTSTQKARYIIFNLDFNRIIMEKINRLRQPGQKNN